MPGTSGCSRAGSRTRPSPSSATSTWGSRPGRAAPSITFVAKVGSFADKTARLVRLVEALGGDADAREAARLAKADQAAELVREFPDLEGHIGAQYARLARKPEAVCQAIEEQYLPDAAGGPLPASPAGQLVAAAEKLDNLVASFSIGQRPTGSRDPYGLRRAAIGLRRLAREGGLALDLRALVPTAHALLVEQGADVSAEPPLDVVDFVEERFEQLLDVPVEVVRAARAAGLHDLGAVARLAEALAGAPGTEEFAAAAAVHERAGRIAAKAEAPPRPVDRPAPRASGADALPAVHNGGSRDRRCRGRQRLPGGPRRVRHLVRLCRAVLRRGPGDGSRAGGSSEPAPAAS
ncbi:MAG: glycine--tRNA ligase subunit beta [Thermoleophilia bacterium]